MKHPVEETVLVEVNGTPVTEGDVEKRLESPRHRNEVHAPSKAEKQRVLQELIDETLLLQEAERRKMDKDATIKDRVKRYEKKLIIEKLQNSLRDSASRVGEEEIAAYYKTHRDQFNIPPMLKLRQIVVSDPVTAKNLYNKLNKDDGSFVEMARRYSVDAATKARGGLIGLYRKGTGEKSFEDAVYGIKKPMQFAPVFQTQQGYHIVQLLERREGISRSLEQFKPIIQRRITVEKEKKLLKELLTKLKEKAKIRIINKPDV
ncbi:MAG: hypothetical protein GXP58_01855 [Deltaproteobacteria bacterium]|nr:hypothetical protein [Deltaproteobacteria bacterium]